MADEIVALDGGIRGRIKDLNLKAYYLLVALSFIYRTSAESYLLKWAFTLTAIVAVLPVQDWTNTARGLKRIQISKVVGLTAALILAILWIWGAAAPHN